MLAASLAILPVAPASARDLGGCFLVDESGQHVDLGSLCGKGNADTSGAGRSGVFRTPIKRRRGGIPVIDVTFNGGETFEMMLDTGASGVVVPANVARQLRLQTERIALVSTPSSRSVRLPVSRVASLEVAGIVARNIEVIVTPALDLGLLGQSFFGSYDITIREDVIEFRSRRQS